MSKQEVEGIILVITCHKHLNTRLKEFKLPKNNYGNWKVIYAIGDLRLKAPYKLVDNFLTIRCEDSYIHLLKKVVLAMEILYEKFNIKQGILRCGDDLIFNEVRLVEFLNSSKSDYMGFVILPTHNFDLVRPDYFMYSYYQTHKEDFSNELHGLQNVDISKYVVRSNVGYCSGVLMYVSNKVCDVLIKHMNSIRYNVFQEDKILNCYPYYIEDAGIGYMLYKEGILPIYKQFYRDYDFNKDDGLGHSPDYFIACHTNKYKD